MVATNAAVLVESANLLLSDGRAVDTTDWPTMAHAMAESAGRTMKAAEARSTEAVLDVGDELNRTCEGEALLYSWKATAAVNYELHAEPDGAPRGYAQSYEKRDAVPQASGTLTAPFSGIHGWFWENTTDWPVTLTLQSAGFYTLAHEFRGGGVTNKTFAEP